MPRLKIGLGSAILSLFVLAATAMAQPGARRDVFVSHAWIRPTAAHAPTAAGYAILVNQTDRPDILLDATSPAADRLEIHRMTMDRGIMAMTVARRGVALPPRSQVDLQRAGYHLMIIRPIRPLRVGDHVPVTLRFQNAGRLQVDFIVGEPGTARGAMPGMRM